MSAECVSPAFRVDPRDPMERGPLRGGGLCSTEVGGGGGCQGVVGEGDKFVSLASWDGVPLQHHVTTFTSASVYRFIINEAGSDTQ